MRIVLDAMGGDSAPYAPVRGALLYDRETKGSDEILLIGDEPAIRAELARNRNSKNANIRVIHASESIDMNDQPVTAVRRKKDSSIVKGLRMQKDGDADAFVSGGSTGAQMAASLLILGRVKGVQRPALGAFIPHEAGAVLLIDVGANADCKPIHLLQFGLMGGIFMEYIFNLEKTRVALLNIGEEETKGNELMNATYPLMKKHLSNFIGNVEGRDMLDGKADVVVTDGFTGNIVLKFAEGMFSVFGKNLKRRIKKNILAMAGMLLASPAFKSMRKAYDYEEHGGVPLLGIDGVSIICHGSSTEKAYKNALHVARLMREKEINEHIQEELSLRGSKWDEEQLLQA